MATIIPPWPPVRRMEPVPLSKFLTRKKMDVKLKKGILSAIKTYNSSLLKASKTFEGACKRAAEKMERDFDKL